MRRALFFILLITLFLLAACSSNDEEVIEDIVEETDEDVVEEVVTEDLTVIEEVKGEVEEEEELLSENLLLEKRLGHYDYEETTTLEKVNLYGYTFDGFEAQYEFANTDARVSVYYAGDKKVNLFDFINEIDENENFDLLEAEDFDLEYDVYFNPYENLYLWISKGKVITIQYAIGMEIVEDYLEKYFVSEIQGTYIDEEVDVKLKGEDSQTMIILNDNSYVFELVNVDRTDNEITLSINDEKKIFGVGEEGFLSGLMIDVGSVNFNTEEVTIFVEREILHYDTFQVTVGDAINFDMDGKSYFLEGVSASSIDDTVILELNGVSARFEEGDTKTLSGLKVKLTELLINDIGEISAIILVEVWIE